MLSVFRLTVLFCILRGWDAYQKLVYKQMQNKRLKALF